MLINEENNRNDLEEEFDNWVSDFMTKAYNQMDEDEYTLFCSNVENLLAQYTDPDYFPGYSTDDFISDIGYEEDDEAWFSEAYTRGDIVKFDLGKDKNDFHHGVIMKAKNGKYTVRDESGNNVDIDDNMIIEKVNDGDKSRKFFSVERIGFDGYLNWIEPNKYYKGNYRYICTCPSDDDNQDWDIVENNDTGDMFYTNI